MRIAVAFDRRGARLKSAVIAELMRQGHEVLDLGLADPQTEADYAAKALAAAEAILSGIVERSVVAFGSGVGASFAANKIEGIHAGACSDTYTAQRGAEAGMNLLCLGSDVLTQAEAAEIVRAFVTARRATAFVAPQPVPIRAASHAA